MQQKFRVQGPARRLVTGFVGCLGMVACLGSVGCASDAAIDSRLKELEAQVKKVQNRADHLEERVTAVELTKRQPKTVTQQAPPPAERPELEVVRLTPDGKSLPAADAEERSPDPAEAGPRPVIRASGAGEGRIDNFEADAKPEPEPPRSGRDAT